MALVGLSGLEPPTLRLSVVRSSQLSYKPVGGDSRDRTGDLLLARQALSQLSYIPMLSLVPPGRIPSKLNNESLTLDQLTLGCYTALFHAVWSP